MRRWAFNVFAAVSLVLCIGAVVLWARSYWVRDIVSWGVAGGNSHIAQSIRGRLHVLSNLDGNCAEGGVSHASDRLGANAIWNGGMSSYPVRPEWHMGFIWQKYGRYHMGFIGDGGGRVSRHRLIVAPYWALATVCAVLPAIWCWRWRGRRRKKRMGLCTTCGYDLRAHRPGERCPECGTVIAAGAAMGGEQA